MSASSFSNPTSFGLLLRQVRDALMRRLDEAMAELQLGLSAGHYIGMRALAEMSPCSANALAQAIDQNPSAVTRLLDKFEDLGWVRREVHAHDRRALRIVLNDAGRASWEQLQPLGDEAIASALRDLSVEERDHLASLLIRVRDSLNSQ